LLAVKSLILPAFLVALLSPPILQASLEPPPVTLACEPSGAVVPGRAFLVRVTATNTGPNPVFGRLAVRPAAGLAVAGRATVEGVRLSPGEHRVVTFAVTPSVEALRELDLGFTVTGTDRDAATLRLFVRAGIGGRVLTLQALLDEQATRTVTGPDGRQVRLFALRAGPATPRRSREGAVVTGRLFYTAYRGEQVAAYRMRAELWSETGSKRTLVDSGDVAIDGTFALKLPAGRAPGVRFVPVFTLKTARWTVSDDRSKVYGWEAPAVTDGSTGADLGALQVPSGQAAQEACWIHTVLNRALDLFSGLSLDIAWWPSIPIEWPASGDYFSWGTVCLTKAFQWDVVGHEFGHAIFHFGSDAQGAGGQHYIDRCYSPTLAWSEGWASYFSGVIQCARDDADARFEFMVPRRAPIRIENVPADVCAGQTNEWRVAAALWDVYDTHLDGDDAIAIDFPTMWAAMHEGGSLSSLKEYVKVLGSRLTPEQSQALDRSLRSNTIEP
jgi:hypothetical protein